MSNFEEEDVEIPEDDVSLEDYFPEPYVPEHELGRRDREDSFDRHRRDFENNFYRKR